MRRQITIIIILAMIGFAIPVQAQGATQDLLERINNLRAELGLAPYSLNSSLTAAATSHAQWMVNTSQVSHIQDNGSSPQTRAQANGYNSSWVSENIYMGGLATADSAWDFWINSPIHYAGLTSENFQEIGIGTAQGTGGQAYVLVFGVPGGATTSNTQNSASSSNDNQAAAPALAIVGYDEVGNIQYELQAGDTLGQVLLLFGYTWDDLNTLLELNDFTEADMTALSVGQVVLVPPPQGTYTPTPLVEVTEEIIVANTAEGIIPTPLPDVTSTEDSIIEQVGEAATYVFVTASPTMTLSPSPIPTLQVNLPLSTAVAQVATPIADVAIIETTPNEASSPPLWLIAAIVVQIGVLGIATFEYVRRSRR